MNQIKLNDSQGNPRQIWIRYLRGYPGENNDWGDFQTHRKALGLISVGQCNSQEEFNELCRIHESLKVGYAFSLYDSRCVLFGLNSDGSLYEGSHSSDVSPCVDADEVEDGRRGHMGDEGIPSSSGVSEGGGESLTSGHTSLTSSQSLPTVSTCLLFILTLSEGQ